MTITIGTNCSTIVVQSSAFNATNISNSISVKVNNGTAITLTPTASATSYTITPASLGVSAFAEGVYEIKLTSVLISSATSTDIGCTAILCDTKCSSTALSWYSDPTKISKALALEGLKVASDCETCGCSLMLTLYNTINESTTDNCECGCS